MRNGVGRRARHRVRHLGLDGVESFVRGGHELCEGGSCVLRWQPFEQLTWCPQRRLGHVCGQRRLRHRRHRLRRGICAWLAAPWEEVPGCFCPKQRSRSKSGGGRMIEGQICRGVLRLLVYLHCTWCEGIRPKIRLDMYHGRNKGWESCT